MSAPRVLPYKAAAVSGHQTRKTFPGRIRGRAGRRRPWGATQRRSGAAQPQPAAAAHGPWSVMELSFCSPCAPLGLRSNSLSTLLCWFFIASKNFQGTLDFAELVKHWGSTDRVTLLREHPVVYSKVEIKEGGDRMKYSCWAYGSKAVCILKKGQKW